MYRLYVIMCILDFVQRFVHSSTEKIDQQVTFFVAHFFGKFRHEMIIIPFAVAVTCRCVAERDMADEFDAIRLMVPLVPASTSPPYRRTSPSSVTRCSC
jgi:hypothetical protein